MAAGLITVPAFAGAGDGIRHFFGTRLQPASAEAWTRASGTMRRSPQVPTVIVSVSQVHGTDALVVDRRPKAGAVFPGGWDALVTDQPGVLLTIRTADCVPVLLYDARRRVVAAIHAGWRGTVAGIVPQTLSLVKRQFAANLDDIRLAIGPSAGPCCYEVDEAVLARLRASYPSWPRVAREIGRGKALLDLRELIRRQAESAGVQAERMSLVGVCTICHPQLFYSYRREGVVKNTMVSGVMLAASLQ